MKHVLTVGAVAKLLGVAPRTVAKLIDDNKLVGFKLPGSAHRKIARADLVKFAVENNLPDSVVRLCKSE